MPDAGDAADPALGNLLIRTIVDLYHRLHQEMRDDLQGLDPQALSWTPGPDTNSVSTLVVHLLTSEAEMLRSVRGQPTKRDRSAEFAAHPSTREELLGLIDAAERDLDQIGVQMTPQDLQAQRARPNNPAPQFGLFWLLRNYGHAREHLAHLQLTKQLYSLARPDRQ